VTNRQLCLAPPLCLQNLTRQRTLTLLPFVIAYMLPVNLIREPTSSFFWCASFFRAVISSDKTISFPLRLGFLSFLELPTWLRLESSVTFPDSLSFLRLQISPPFTYRHITVLPASMSAFSHFRQSDRAGVQKSLTQRAPRADFFFPVP